MYIKSCENGSKELMTIIISWCISTIIRGLISSHILELYNLKITFELYDFIINWYTDLIAMEWRVGQMTISLGGILAFLGIFIFCRSYI